MDNDHGLDYTQAAYVENLDQHDDKYQLILNEMI